MNATQTTHAPPQQRRLIDIDRPPALSRETLDAAAQAEARLRTYATALPAVLDRLSRRIEARDAGRGDALLGALRHPLSDLLLARSPRRPRESGRSTLEARVLDASFAGLRPALQARDADALAGVAERLCTQLANGTPTRCRQGPMALAVAAGEAPITFVAPTVARRRLAEILAALRIPPAGSALVAAAQTLVATVNAHAMNDGNGRLSRVLFHYRLRCAGLAPHGYLPLYETFHASDGGYEIRLRLAELHGEWDPFVRYLCDVVACTTEHAA